MKREFSSLRIHLKRWYLQANILLGGLLLVGLLFIPPEMLDSKRALSASADEASCEPFPFVYTAEVLYGSFRGAHPNCYPIPAAAKFDLLITTPQAHRLSKWCSDPTNPFQNSLQAIKSLNPKTQILLYRMGPGQVITSTWGTIGDGWAWIKSNHGKDTADRWTALGAFTQDYLVALPYPVERAMEIGNPNWQDYWIKRNYEDIWVNKINNLDGSYADGIFADGMQYGVSWADKWCPESKYNPSTRTCDQKDHPSTYYQNNTYNQSLWYQHYGQFLNRAVPYFRQRGLRFGLNAWRIGHPDQIALYRSLEVTAMEECGFLCTGRLRLNEWEAKLSAMQNANGYEYLTVNLAPGYSENNPPGAMDSTFCAEGVCQDGWKWLWYSLGSYWLAYEPQRQNTYFYFSLWEYRGTLWFDEYNPRYLHLGLPKEPTRKLQNGLWVREFRRGWVVVNPTLSEKTIQVPQAKARLLDHSNFKNPATASPASQFNIPALNGVILLKEPQPSPLSCTYLPLLSR